MAKIYKIILLLLFLGMFPFGTEAATLYFSPSSGSHLVDSVLSVSVYVSSADQAINAASGVISFPSDKLEIVSLSKSGSIFSLWVQEPSFSNSPDGGQGAVNFEGVVLNPGFTGSSGKIITANFRVKAPGVAILSFSSGLALANDGQGTDILKSLGSAQFSLDSAGPTVPVSTTPTIAYGTPSAPQIFSPTHPDPNTWYAKKDALFKWEIPDDVTAIRLSFGELPRSTPTTVYEPTVSEKELSNLVDGIQYFHAQLSNAKGWGEISHFRFQIDTEKPNYFNITEIPRADIFEPKASFIFDARDKTSGIDHYEIKIDGEDIIVWRDDKSKTYATPVLGAGKHTLIAKAVDKAGNTLMSAAEFAVEALEPPKITEYPKELPSGGILVAKGATYPDSQVKIWLQKEKDDAKSFTVKSGQDGKFIFISDEKLKDGVYKLWAEVVNDKGAKSQPSDKLAIRVTPSAFLRIGSWAVNFFAVLIPLLALLIVTIMLIWYGWHKFLILKGQVRKEVGEAESELHRSFDFLREDLQKQIKSFEKIRSERYLTEEEENTLKQLKKDLDDSEKSVGKEIEDIEKMVK